MITEYDTKQIKLNADLAGNKVGTIKKIKVDKAGTPVERYWRDRLKDAKIDNCVELVGGQSSEVPKPVEKPVKEQAQKKPSKKTSFKR